MHDLDDLAAYALDALEAPARARVVAHVRGCETCARRLSEYRAVVGVLPLALDPLAPPPAAWRALAAQSGSSGLPPRPDVP